MLCAIALLTLSVVLFIDVIVSGINKFVTTRKIAGVFKFGQLVLALILWGMGSKLLWWPFAGFAMVGGCFLLIGMYGGIAVISLLKLFKGDRLNRGLTFLASATAVFMLLGIVTKIQHWPFPAEYRIAGIALMVSTIIYFFVIKFFLLKEKQTEWNFYKSIPGILPYLFTAFVIISIHFWGWQAGVFPGFYSIERPITWVALEDAESTPESDSRFEIYNDNLEYFWSIRNNSFMGIPINDSISNELREQFKTSPNDTLGKLKITL